jgi:hypothetical protein
MRAYPLALGIGVSLSAALAASRSLANPPRTPAGAGIDACEVPANVAPENARKTADELFERAKRLREQGKLADACVCLDASDRLAPGRGGTVLNLGLCREQEGKLAAAYRELQRALAKARQDGRADREALASERLAEIQPRLAWLSITLPSNVDAARVTVKLDGEVVDGASLGALPVDAGKHVVTVSAEGFETRTVDVASTAGERRPVRIDPLTPLGDSSAAGVAAPAAAPALAPAPPAAPPAPASAPERPASPGTDSSSQFGGPALKTAALVVGIAGIAVSLGAGAWALERKGAVKSNCDAEKKCDDTGVSAASTGRALVTVGTAAFAVGAVGIGAWALLPSQSGNGARAASVGLSAKGVF